MSVSQVFILRASSFVYPTPTRLRFSADVSCEHFGSASFVQDCASCIWDFPHQQWRKEWDHSDVWAADAERSSISLSCGSNQRAWTSCKVMILGAHDSIGKVMMTSLQLHLHWIHIRPGTTIRHHSLRMDLRGRLQVCAVAIGRLLSCIYRSKPFKCDEDTFSDDSDGSAIFGGYVEDSIWDHNAVRWLHMTVRGNQVPTFGAAVDRREGGSTAMHHLRQSGKRFATGRDAHQHLKLGPSLDLVVERPGHLSTTLQEDGTSLRCKSRYNTYNTIT